MSGGSSRVPTFGKGLRRWRSFRGVSQLALASRAGVSARHLSFLETGRATPSRQMVMVLGEALELALRDRNALLESAGFAPAFHETDLDAPELAQVRRVLGWILEGCEPNGAAVLNRRREIVLHNSGWRNQMSSFLDLDDVSTGQTLNALRILFHPKGLRNVLVNFEQVGRTQLSRFYREISALQGPRDLVELLDELLAFPDVPDTWRFPDPAQPDFVVLPMHVRTATIDVRIFNTVTTVGSPQDVTLQELRVEALAPADPESEQILTRLGRGERP